INTQLRRIALTGPLNGSAIALQEGEMSIGRDVTNALSIEDRAVSRKHCIIRMNGSQIEIQDLGSSNRTQVNGIPIEQCSLKHSDEITVGRSRFVLLLDEGTAEPSPAICMEEGDV